MSWVISVKGRLGDGSDSALIEPALPSQWGVATSWVICSALILDVGGDGRDSTAARDKLLYDERRSGLRGCALMALG
jgi:hypothetical protein